MDEFGRAAFAKRCTATEAGFQAPLLEVAGVRTDTDPALGLWALAHARFFLEVLKKGQTGREGDPNHNRHYRSSVRDQKIAGQNSSAGKKAPFQFHIMITEVAANNKPSTKAGWTSDFFHSGFCVPSRCRRRIS